MDNDTVKAITAALQPPVIGEGATAAHRYALAPEGWTLIDLAKVLGPQDHIQQRVQMQTVDSLLDYLDRFGTDTSVVFANEQEASFEAVLDYHPGRGDITLACNRGECAHSLVYQCPQSDHWKAWKGNNGRMLAQEEFALFIEANMPDIVQPPAADMLQVALNLQVRKDAQFESGLRLDSGEVQFRYTETIRGSAGTKAGDLKIPPTFTLRLPVLLDGPVFEQKARFRYRVESGKLTLGYDLIRPDDTFRKAVRAVTEVIIAANKGAWPVMRGKRL